jgi:phage/plasmid-like protein (TIGR03299 family)
MHELHITNGRAAMAYTGEKPWHGLGQNLSPDADLDTWIREAGFDWEVKRSAIKYDFQDEEGQIIDTRTVSKRFALYRSDTGDALSVMSSNFHITQPRDVMEFFRDLIELAGFKMETAGMLRGGATYWALARVGDHFDVGGGDIVLPRLLLATACDGTLSNTGKFCTERVVCANTLSVALDERTHSVRIPHSTKFNPERFKRDLGLLSGSWERFKKTATDLSKRKVSKEEATRYFVNVFYKDEDEIDVEAKRPMLDLVTKIYLEGIGQNVKTAQGTAWGLLNAVTRWADHERKAASRDTRMQSSWFGSAARTKDFALDEAIALL